MALHHNISVVRMSVILLERQQMVVWALLRREARKVIGAKSPKFCPDLRKTGLSEVEFGVEIDDFLRNIEDPQHISS